MDCEQFDLIAIDMLYGEATEADAAEARRHMERCDRCSATLASLRSARKAVSMPLEDAPAGIEEALVEAARRAQREYPWPRRIGRAISWAGSYAMRPQLAMAALLLLMIGSSLLLVRGRPGAGQVGVVRVTEQGVPEREHGDYAASPSLGALPPHDTERARRAAPAAARAEAESAARDRAELDTPQAVPPVAAASEASRSTEYDEAMALYEAKDFSKAQRAFDSLVAQGGPEASQAALYAAKSARASTGCGAALPKFDGVVTRYGNTTAAVQARWEAAECAKRLGNYDRARQVLADLRNIEGQRDRADHELAKLGPTPRGTRAAPDRRPAGAKPAPAKTNAF
jgi:hypothetical protein